MKKILLLFIILNLNTAFAQTSVTTDEHWTAYALSIAPENEETVYNIFDNYFSENKLDGVILAAAGIKSLNLNSKVGFIFGTTEILPAAGQGVIAVQCRKNNTLIQNFLKKINHLETSLCSIAERKMLETIGGDCETAIGALAEIENSKLKLKAQLFSDVGNECFEYELTGKDLEASNIGKSVGEKLLQLAGRSFKKK